MDWPQILTTITEGNAISTVVDAPWVSVTSVNGMTGDVFVEPVVKGFQANHYYQKDTVITYNGELYSAKVNFTSGSSFNVVNWDLLSSQVQSDWSVSDSSSKAFIKNKPTIGNATLTIQKNGTNVQTFTANATSNKTANIVVPTKTSDLTNDSNFAVDANYVHTDNNFTTTLKNKLNGIAEGAEVNVQSDWNQSSTTADDYIKNKPTIGNATLTIQKNGSLVKTFTANATSNVTANITVPTKTSELTNDSDFATKLYVQSRGENLVTNGSGLLQNNYNFSRFTFDPLVANGTPGSFRTNALNTVIKNDELIPVDITQEYKLSFDIRTTNSSARFYDTIFSYDVDGNQIMYYNVNWLPGTTTTLSQKLSPGDTVVHLTSLSGWNTTTTYSHQKGFIFWNYVNSFGYAWGTETYSRNMYRDLYTDNSAVNKTANTITLRSAWTGPEIPAGTSVSQCTDGSNYIYIGTTNYTVTANTWVHRESILTKNLYRIGTAFVGVGWLANRNISGTISTWFNNVQFAMYTAPITVDSALSSTSINPVQNKIINSALGTKANISDLATVATSGSYNDLSNKPTIPTVNNAILTIQKNGVNVQTFTANQGTNATANITVPTKTSDLTNDSGFIDSVAWGDVTGKPTFATVATSGSYNDLSNKPTIPTVNNATLTIQKNGSTVKTFTANASTNVTANITVPTKTSDITNDSDFATNADAQKWVSNNSTVAPNFEGMTPVKTFTWSGVADTNYRAIYQFDNTGWTFDNMDVEVAYRITVTGTNIKQVTDIVDRWIYPLQWPITSIMCRTLSGSAETTGYRYLRAVYPLSAGLNNNTYKFGQEIATYNTTSRTITVEVFKTQSGITWNETRPSASIYTNSTYQTNNSLQPYGTRGWMFRAPASFNATSADVAARVSSYESSMIGVSLIKGGEAMTSAHLAFLADDGKMYLFSNTTKNMVCDENARIGVLATGYNANTAIDTRYLRSVVDLNYAQVGTISHDTLALGSRVYLRCTMDANGNIHSDNYLATSMTPGYTWLPFGVATASSTIYMDVRKPTFYTLNAEGKVTHINGKVLAGSGGGGGGSYTAGNHITIVNDVISAVDYVHSETLTAATTPSGTVTTAMIANGAITRDKLASDAKFTLTMSTTDISEGSALATNTLYGVYNA